jgi:ABC-type transport system substrate-binding protein
MRWNTAVCSGWDWWMDPKGKDFGPESKVYFYDPAEAKKLVQAAGYEDGVSTVINWTPNGYDAAYVREIEVMKAMWEMHGDFKFRVNLPDYRSDWRPQVHYNYDRHEGIAWGGNASQPDLDGAMQAWFKSGKDRSGHVMANGQPDPVLDHLVARQRMETDYNQRAEVLKDFQRYAAKTMYVYFGAGASTEFEMAQPWLGNWGVYRTAPGGADSNETFPYLYIDPDKKA